jgi:hypothetical protein
MLARVGHTNEARTLLGDLWSQRNRLPRERLDFIQGEIANVYGYLGDTQVAREIATSLPASQRLLVECIIARRQHDQTGTADVSQLVERLNDAGVAEPSAKHGAHTQTAVLEILLELENYEEAWNVLPSLKASLLACVLWGKFEWRTGDASAVLSPYAQSHAAQTHAFAASILVERTLQALQAGHVPLWEVTHAVSGISPLLARWVSEDEIANLIGFLQEWNSVTGASHT